jgi:hypothetical protein
MLKDTKIIIKGTLWALGLNFFVFYIFFEQWNVEKHGRKDIGEHWKGLRKLLMRRSKALKKKTSWVLKIFKF